MAKQGEAAYAYFLKGYNCSQSVVAAFAPQLGLSEEMALRMSAGFGAGIGRMREVCGAFCGVVTVLSLVYADPADPQDKSRMYALVLSESSQDPWDGISSIGLFAPSNAQAYEPFPEDESAKKKKRKRRKGFSL